MSTQPALQLPSTSLAAPARALPNKRASIDGMTATGPLLFLISILVVGSGYLAFRPVIMGLSLHPYLVPMAAALPLVVLARIAEFPVKVLAALVVFTVMYCFSALSGSRLPIGEIFKVGTALVTIVAVALMVRKRGDFVAGALGLSIAIALLAVRGLQDESAAGVDPMEGANKNSYSMFALPAILMAGYIATRLKTSIVVKSLLVGGSLPALLAIFLSANRSGYVGAALIGMMLFWDRRGKGMLLVGGVTAALMFLMSNYADTKVLNERMRQTVEGNESDELRVAILWTCTWLALENPIIGVSPVDLPFQIGQRTNVGHSFHVNFLAPHNVFAHVAAGSGLICLAGLMAAAYTMWTLKPANGRPFGNKDDPARQARSLVRMMVILWGVRGLFTHEVLYNPACNIGLGLCLGLFIVSQWAPAPDGAAKGKAAQAQAPRPSPPAVGVT